MTMLLYHFISQDLEGNICAKYTEDLKKKTTKNKQTTTTKQKNQTEQE